MTLTTKLDIPRGMRNKAPMRMDRCRKSLSGIVACSPRFHWRRLNDRIRRPNPKNNPTALELRHLIVCPPHCNTSNKQQIAPRNNNVPSQSMCRSFVDTGSALFPLLQSLSFTKTKIETRTIAPTGTFLGVRQNVRTIIVSSTHTQKHHLQLALSVNTPPSTGPMHTLTPKELTTMP